MRYINLLGDRGDRELMLHDFDTEMHQIERMHQYVVTTSHREFYALSDEISEELDPEHYDGGDVIGIAEERLGINPWDVAAHSGLMAISRATSLSEVMLARMAAHFIQDSARFVFPGDGLWSRQREEEFYKSVLKTPFRTNSGAFSAMRGLRDLYIHGYGVPATEKRRSRLAERLYQFIDRGPATQPERDLGYEGQVYFFGWDSSFSPSKRAVTPSWTSSGRADISPLAAYRMLMAAKAHVHAAYCAFDDGFHDDLDEEEPKFIKTVLREEARRFPPVPEPDSKAPSVDESRA